MFPHVTLPTLTKKGSAPLVFIIKVLETQRENFGHQSNCSPIFSVGKVRAIGERDCG